MPASHNGSSSAAIAAPDARASGSASAALKISGWTQRDRFDFEQQLAAADFGFEDQNIDVLSKRIAQALN
jgi:hypothetical protein